MNNQSSNKQTLKINLELTDTFGGEANYSRVKRRELIVDDEPSDLAIVRRAKKEMGMSGMRCAVDNSGDMITLRPYGVCHVLFITFETE